MSQKISDMTKLPTLLGATKIPTGEVGPGGNYATDPDQILALFAGSFWPLGGSAIGNAATASGTDTYVLTLSPALTSYANLTAVYVKFTNANTGASTININGLGAKAIKKNVSTDLVAGDIPAGSIFWLIYDGTNFQLIGGTNPPDATETTKGISEIATTTEAETGADNTLGNRDHTRILTARGARALLEALGWTFDSTDRLIQQTGLDTADTVIARWRNASLEDILTLYNDLKAVIGGPTSRILVNAGVLSDNAFIQFLTNITKAYKFHDGASDYLVFRSTTSDLAVEFHQSVEHNYGQGFIVKNVQAMLRTSTTAATWNNILTLSVPADTLISLKVHHLNAYATDRSAVEAYGAMNGLVKRDNANNTVSAVPAFTLVGAAASEEWRIAADDTAETATIDFLNSTGTGKTWDVFIHASYIRRSLPTL